MGICGSLYALIAHYQFSIHLSYKTWHKVNHSSILSQNRVYPLLPTNHDYYLLHIPNCCCFISLLNHDYKSQPMSSITKNKSKFMVHCRHLQASLLPKQTLKGRWCRHTHILYENQRIFCQYQSTSFTDKTMSRRKKESNKFYLLMMIKIKTDENDKKTKTTTSRKSTFCGWKAHPHKRRPPHLPFLHT